VVTRDVPARVIGWREGPEIGANPLKLRSGERRGS
jgi:hypothetical protein